MSEPGLAELLHDAAPERPKRPVDDELITELWGEGRRRRSRARRARGAMVVLAVMIVVGTGFALAVRSPSHTTVRVAIGTDPEGSEPGVGGTAPTAAAVGSMRIPAIGVDTPIFSGDGDMATLQGGPVLLTTTAAPGPPGDAVVMGHRVTYGAPFNRLDELNPGDRIEVTIGADRFTYEVVGQSSDIAGGPPVGHRIVTPGDGPYGIPEALLDAPNQTAVSRLTLVTYNPKYSTAERLVVDAILVTG